MNVSQWICLASSMTLSLMVVLPTAYAGSDTESDEPCTVRAIEGGVECIDSDGNQQWKTHHPALWSSTQSYIAGDQGARPIEPITIDDTAFYAIARDLLEVDVADGVIQNRVRFPDNIGDLVAASDGMLDVELEAAATAFLQALNPRPAGDERPAVDARPAASAPQPRVVSHNPGTPGPARETLSMADIVGPVATAQDAHRLLASAAGDSQAIELLRGAQQTDPTNPFLAQLMGMVLEDSGDDEAALQAFTRAANSPDAPWQDLLQLSGLLDGSSLAPEQADTAFRLGMEQMQSLGLDAQNLAGLLPMVTTVLGNNQDLADILSALEAGNIDEAIRLGMVIAENLPDAATFQGKWQAIADENEAAAYEIVAEKLQELDCVLLLLAGLLIGLILLVILVGMRAGVSRKLRIRDLLAPLAVFVVLLAFPYYLNTHVSVAEEIASLPIADIQSGFDTPEGQQWLMSMADDPAVQDLVASLFSSPQEAEDAPGAESHQRVPLLRLMVDAAYIDAEQAQWDLLRSGQMPDLIAALALLDANAADFDGSQRISSNGISLAYAFLPLLFFMLLGALGYLLGRFAPVVARPLLQGLPGGSKTLAPLGGLTLVAIVIALVAVLGFDTIAQTLALPELQTHLNLDDVDHLRSTPSRTWAWITLATAAVIHGAIVAWDISR